MNNKIVIEALKSFYGYTTKEAAELARTATDERKKYLIEGYKQQNKKAFYND